MANGWEVEPSCGRPSVEFPTARIPATQRDALPKIGSMARWRLGRFERRGEPHREQNQPEAHGVVPSEFFLQHDPGEDHEYPERDALLDDLELVAAELAAEVAAAVGRDHQAVLEKRDSP